PGRQDIARRGARRARAIDIGPRAGPGLRLGQQGRQRDLADADAAVAEEVATGHEQPAILEVAGIMKQSAWHRSSPRRIYADSKSCARSFTQSYAEGRRATQRRQGIHERESFSL